MMISEKTIQKYESGALTLYGVYEKCETDIEMYQFISEYVSSNERDIKEYMLEVSGANDAYYNALAEMEEDEEDEESEEEDEKYNKMFWS